MAATYIPPAASESDPVASAALATAVASLTAAVGAKQDLGTAATDVEVAAVNAALSSAIAGVQATVAANAAAGATDAEVASAVAVVAAANAALDARVGSVESSNALKAPQAALDAEATTRAAADAGKVAWALPANGATDGSALTTQLAALAAAGGGTLRARPGAPYVIEAPATIPSGCTLDVSGCTIQRKAGYTTPAPNFLGQGPYLIQNTAVLPARTVTDASVVGTTTSALLSTAAAITALPVAAIPAAGLPSGAIVQLRSGTNTQRWTLTSAAASGATSLAVASQTPNFAYPSASVVSSNVVTSATAAFTASDVGRTVTVVGAGRTGGFESAPVHIYTTILSMTATRAVLAQPAWTVATSTTMQVYGARDATIGLVGNVNTIIDNGNESIAANYGNSTNTPKAIQLRRIGRCIVHLGGAACIGGGKQGNQFITPGDIDYLEVDGLSMNCGMGGPQMYGPFGVVKISNIRGYTADDFVCIQPAAYGWTTWDGNDCQGPIGTVTISDLHPAGSATLAVDIFGGKDNANDDCPIGDITIERVYGSSVTGLAVKNFGGGLMTIGRLTLRDIDHTITNATQSFSVIVASLRDLVLDNVRLTATKLGTSAVRQMGMSLSGTFTNVTARQFATPGDYVDAIRCDATLAASSTIDKLAIKDHAMASCVGGRLVSVYSQQSNVPFLIKQLEIEGARVVTGDSAGQSAIVYASPWATINEINVSRFRIEASSGNTWAQAFALLNDGQSTRTRLRLAQGSTSGDGTVLVKSAVALDLALSQVRLGHSGSVSSTSGGGSVTVLSDVTAQLDQAGLISHTAAIGTSALVTTTPIDTTGATLLVAAVAHYTPTVPTTAQFSDSLANTWTALSDYANATGTNSGVRIFYCANPTTGAAHTFTHNQASSFPVVAVAAFKDTVLSVAADISAGATGTGGTISPGSITPPTARDLIISALGYGPAGTVAVNSGFTITDQLNVASGGQIGVAMAYAVQGPAVAVNPAWTKTGANGAAAIAAFKRS